ncbi:MAG: sulfurtransferase TusA [Pseudohongiellaceae bacterium]
MSSSDCKSDPEDLQVSEPNHDAELDARGLLCPEPVMLLHTSMAGLATDQVLKVVATDPSTTRDIPRFCQFLNHPLLAQEETEGEYLYWIRKGAP